MKNLVLLCWSVALLSWPVIAQSNMPLIFVWLYPFVIWLLLIVGCITPKHATHPANDESDR